jgi:hypothetical protein
VLLEVQELTNPEVNVIVFPTTLCTVNCSVVVVPGVIDANRSFAFATTPVGTLVRVQVVAPAVTFALSVAVPPRTTVVGVVNLLSSPAATVPDVVPVVMPIVAEVLVPELVIGAVTATTPDGP